MALSNAEVRFYFGQCKCCLNYAYLKNMWEQHRSEGAREIYGKMLVDCFSISWTIKDKVDDDKICEVCIRKLRDAICFKNQVIYSQNKLLQIHNDEDLQTKVPDLNKKDTEAEKSADLKGEQVDFENIEFLEETEEEVGKELVETDSWKQDDSEDSDSEPLIKKRKLPQKIPLVIQPETQAEDQLDEATEVCSDTNTKEAPDKQRVQRKTISAIVKELLKETEKGDHESESDEDEQIDHTESILNKHRDNIQSILLSSNATPIKGHWGIGYACYFCPEQFTIPSDLKTHTFEHKAHLSDFKIKSLPEHIVKLDVTALKCNMCDMNMKSLETLMLHIKEIHQMPMHLHIPNHIVPFSFDDGEMINCVKCTKQFSVFKNLSEHMNDVHFRNYECDKCPRGFVNMRALRTHSIRHGKGFFPCSLCPKVFNTKIKVIDHKRVVHKLNKMTRKCSYCDEKFVDEVKKSDHEVETHGKKKQDYQCGACQKIFDSARGLLTHINGVHLLRKPHKCVHCESAFFLKHDLKRHILKQHTLNPPSYRCQVCSKKFSSNKNLKEHMHKHKDERNHRCEVCSRRFYKEENYVTHMKNKHGLE